MQYLTLIEASRQAHKPTDGVRTGKRRGTSLSLRQKEWRNTIYRVQICQLLHEPARTHVSTQSGDAEVIECKN